jgi:uncharacterized membrane protein
MKPLLGILVVILGFAFKVNPVLVVAVAAVVTGWAAGLPLIKLLAVIGSAFLKNRFLLLFVLTLPVIGLLERHGLKEEVQGRVARLKAATAGRLLLLYLLLRQVASALGLTSLCGHPQTVRPLLAPMVEAAAQRTRGPLQPATLERLRALAAATDNVGLFFGEDIFVAFGGVLLVQSFFRDQNIPLEPFQIALWGIPTAVAAFLIHGFRLWRLDRKLADPKEMP